VVGPEAEITGAAGVGFTVTLNDVEAGEVQLLPSVWVTVNVPEAETVMLCVVAPFDQRLPVA
jgi:hypothetical protein